MLARLTGHAAGAGKTMFRQGHGWDVKVRSVRAARTRWWVALPLVAILIGGSGCTPTDVVAPSGRVSESCRPDDPRQGLPDLLRNPEAVYLVDELRFLDTYLVPTPFVGCSHPRWVATVSQVLYSAEDATVPTSPGEVTVAFLPNAQPMLDRGNSTRAGYVLAVQPTGLPLPGGHVFAVFAWREQDGEIWPAHVAADLSSLAAADGGVSPDWLANAVRQSRSPEGS